MKLYFTQIDPPTAETVADLIRRGWQPFHLPFRRVEFLEPEDLPVWSNYDAVLLSSKRAALWLLGHHAGGDLPMLAVVGKATSALLPADRLMFEQPASHAAALRARLQARYPSGGRFLFLRGELANMSLWNAWHHARVDDVTVYRTRLLGPDFPPLDPECMVYFQAPSTVSDFAARYCRAPRFVAAIGPTTRTALEARNWPIHFLPTRPETTTFVEELPPPTEFIDADKHE